MPASGKISTSPATDCGDVGHDRQRVVVDEHQLGGVDRGRLCLGDDGDDRLADEPHTIGGEERPGHRRRQVRVAWRAWGSAR